MPYAHPPPGDPPPSKPCPPSFKPADPQFPQSLVLYFSSATMVFFPFLGAALMVVAIAVAVAVAASGTADAVVLGDVPGSHAPPPGFPPLRASVRGLPRSRGLAAGTTTTVFGDAPPSSANCTWLRFNQSLDHFSPGLPAGGAFMAQRYCLYAGFWGGTGSPILFYTGNESPVEVYVNNTGLMWELGQKLGALLVFAEHRYFGQSWPLGPGGVPLKGVRDCLAFLSSAQALADYATLVGHLRHTYPGATQSRVVAFGGSYGGMLAAWLRIKYPGAVAGAIAASAPIWGFPLTSEAADPTYPCKLDGSSVGRSPWRPTSGCQEGAACSSVHGL